MRIVGPAAMAVVDLEQKTGRLGRAWRECNPNRRHCATQRPGA
jgi:hypothetical protein